MNTSTWILFVFFMILIIVENFFLDNEYISYHYNQKLYFKENKARKLINILSSMIFIGVLITALMEGGVFLVIIFTAPIFILIVVHLVKSDKSPKITFDLNSKTLLLEGKYISFKEFKELHFVEVNIAEWPTTYSIRIKTFDDDIIDLLSFNKPGDAKRKFAQINEILNIKKKHIIDRGLLKPIIK